MSVKVSEIILFVVNQDIKCNVKYLTDFICTVIFVSVF